MRILVIDEEIPLPLNTGKRLRTFCMLRPLARRHEIVFACRSREGFDDYDLDAFRQSGMEPVVIAHPIRRKSGPCFYGALFINLFQADPYSAASLYSRPFTSALRSLVQERDFDLIHCENIACTRNLRPFSRIPSVLVAHNLEAMIWERRCEVETGFLRKPYTCLQWKKMERYERWAFGRYDHIVSVSDVDRELIGRRAPNVPVTTIDNGVDAEYFSPEQGKEKPFSIVFTGSLDWFPNEDGLHWFLDQAWPLLRKEYPEASMTIVGRDPGAALQDRAAAAPGVRVAGTVPDVRPFLDEASVYVVPLRVGGGSRLKILEAFAMEKAVVSTTIGAEGLDVTPDKHLLLADTPGEFAGAIGRLFRDQELRAGLAVAGKRLVMERYRWEKLAGKLDRVWRQVGAGSGSKGERKRTEEGT